MESDVDAQVAGQLPAGARSAVAPLNVALLGFGTVGRSVTRILADHPPANLRLTHIYNRRIAEKKEDWVPSSVSWTDDIEVALGPDVDVVVELVGGRVPAEDWIRRALAAGKSVVTANKQVIAEVGPELMEAARRQGRRIGFEASVAGGIPVIRGIQEGLAGDRLSKIVGILNGTCNYILTSMEAAGASFAAALADAQRLGFAEADPTADVDGFDARSKLSILSWIGLGTHLRPASVACGSIRVITDLDFSYARKLGCTIRQVSLAERVPGSDRVVAAVRPALVPLTSPLASVQGSQNLVLVTGKFGGETGFFGFGAGGDPTAVAVVADLVTIAQGRTDPAIAVHSERDVSSDALTELTSAHYVRFTVKDRPGILAALATVFSTYGINIEAVLQEPGYPPTHRPFVITLEECSSLLLEGALREIQQLDFHVEPPVSLPVLIHEARRVPGAGRSS